MNLTTPKTIHDDVYRLREKIGVTTEPVFVAVDSPTIGKLGDCFADVERKVKSDGGSVQHGWTVWESPGTLIEGEFHAVWRSPDGTLLDVTPKADGERRILFIPDPNRTFQNENIDNVRLALSDDPAVNRMIAMNEELSILRRKYNVGTGESKIPMREVLAIQRKYSEPTQPPLRSAITVGRNDRCPCGSGKKFKRCHGIPQASSTPLSLGR